VEGFDRLLQALWQQEDMQQQLATSHPGGCLEATPVTSGLPGAA
jgi:hypothetical protein